MIKEHSLYCRLAQKMAFRRKLDEIFKHPKVKWGGQHFWKGRKMIATPIFELSAIIHWGKPTFEERI